jgi:hypothetical protein
MSLLDIFRKKSEETNSLKKQIELLRRENEIFLEELRILKNAMYGVGLDIEKAIKKKK